MTIDPRVLMQRPRAGAMGAALPPRLVLWPGLRATGSLQSATIRAPDGRATECGLQAVATQLDSCVCKLPYRLTTTINSRRIDVGKAWRLIWRSQIRRIRRCHSMFVGKCAVRTRRASSSTASQSWSTARMSASCGVGEVLYES